MEDVTKSSAIRVANLQLKYLWRQIINCSDSGRPVIDSLNVVACYRYALYGQNLIAVCPRKPHSGAESTKQARSGARPYCKMDRHYNVAQQDAMLTWN